MASVINPYASPHEPIAGTMCPFLSIKHAQPIGQSGVDIQVLPIPCHRGCSLFVPAREACAIRVLADDVLARGVLGAVALAGVEAASVPPSGTAKGTRPEETA